jgi:hypothetical protein
MSLGGLVVQVSCFGFEVISSNLSISYSIDLLTPTSSKIVQ